MIELNLLLYLLEFHKRGSLSKASESLHLSQPSLTKAMQKLEEELGIKIFDRSANKIALNSNGLIVLEYAKDILNIENNLLSFAREVKNNEEEVMIGTSAPGPIFYYQKILKTTSKFGRYVVEIKKEEELLEGLFTGKYDLIFLTHPLKSDGYFSKKAFSEHLYVSMPKDHFLTRYQGPLLFKDIDGQSFLLDPSCGIWQDIVKKNLPNSKFILQEDRDAMKEMREHSSILAFSTDLSKKENEVPSRIDIPISEEEAVITFYVALKENWCHCFKEFL